MSNNAKGRAPELNILHATNSHFQDVANYKIYNQLENLQTCNVKMTARTGKYAERMDTKMRAYKFDNKNSTTTLYFLTQFKRACDSNEISESTAI